MLLSVVYKTLEGAQRRARHEQATSRGKYLTRVVRFHNGIADLDPFSAARFPGYTWKVERVRA